jgi:hypothetical protein
MDKLPSQTVDLITQLDKMYPDNFPINDLGITSPYDIGKKAGVIELIRLFKHLQEKGES